MVTTRLLMRQMCLFNSSTNQI